MLPLLLIFKSFQGDGPKLVRELFRVAEEHAPSIVFIDEIDAVGTKRYDSNSGGEREIQRTMLELLNQLDGFDSRGDVKVIFGLFKFLPETIVYYVTGHYGN
jgi:26S proteasome regulatory subunit T2